MKIAFLVRSLGCGGAERQLALLAARLAGRHEVTILTFYSGEDFFSPGRDAPVRVIPLGKRGRWDLLRFVRRFRREVRRLRPDVIYAFMNTAGLVALTVRTGRSSPAVAWGVRSSNMRLRHYGMVPRALRWLEAWLSRWADVTIANSEAGRREALADGFRTKILVIPNGIDTTRFAYDPSAREARRREWGVSEGTILIGLVGRHDPMKGYETFLKAAAALATRDPRARFVGIGDGPPGYTAALKGLAERCGIASRVIWAGQVADIVGCYSAMDLFTSASVFGEGFSNAIAEALACGLPCVVTDVGDARAIVGDGGAVVPPNDPTALAGAWRQTLASPDQLDEKARARRRARIVEHFSDAAMVNRSEVALERLVAARRAS